MFLELRILKTSFYVDISSWLGFLNMFSFTCKFVDDNSVLITIFYLNYTDKRKFCLATSLLIVDIMAALISVVRAFTSFHNLYKSHWKTSLQNILFKRNHSPFLLTFSFVFFFPVFSDVFTFLSTHLAFNFSYLHLFGMANYSSFHKGKAFCFPFLFYPVFSSQCITSKYKKKHFVECQSLHGYYRIIFN